MDLFKIMGTIALTGGDVVSATLDNVTNKARETYGGMGNAMVAIGTSITNAGRKLVPFSTACGALAGVAVKTSASFSDGMLKVQSLSGATGKEFNQLKQTALDYGSSTAWSASQVADAMGYMALAGFDAGEIMKSTGGMLSLASASGEDLATVTDILTDSMTAFGDGADQASHYADVLATTQAKSNTTVGMLGEAFKYVAPLAGAFGYKVEDVSTSLGMMANAGIKGSMAGTSLSSIITRLGNNTNGARDAIESLGVSFYNSDGTARNLSDVMKDLCDATANMTVEEKSNFATTVAGQEAQKGLLAILNQGSDAYSELEKNIKNCDGSAQAMADNLESGIGGALRSMKSALEGASIALGDALAPTIQSVAEKITALANWFRNLPAPVQQSVAKMLLFGTALAPILMISGKLITGVGTMINVFGKLKTQAILVKEGFTLARAGFSALGMEASVLGSTIGTLSASVVVPILAIIAVVASLVLAFRHLWTTNEEFRSRLIAIWDGVKAKFEAFGQAIVERLNALGFNFSSFTEVVKAIWNAFCNVLAPVFIAVFEIISNVLGVVLDVLVGLLDVFIGIFTGNWSQAWTGIKEIFTAIWNGIKSYYSIVLNAIKSVFSAVWNGIKSVVTSILNAIKSNITSTFNNIKSSITSVLNAIKSVFSSVWNGIKSVVTSAINGVKSTITSGMNGAKSSVTSVLNGIKSSFSSIWNTCVSTVSGAVSKLKSLMNFSWSLPHLKLPHISITGSFSVVPPSVPKFSVSWYKKAMDNPLMFTEPTLFGYNPMTGSVKGAGEAGDEVMIGKNTMLNMIEMAVANQTGNMEARLNRIIDLLVQFFPEALDKMNQQMVLDTGVLVAQTAPAMNRELGRIAVQKGRGR